MLSKKTIFHPQSALTYQASLDSVHIGKSLNSKQPSWHNSQRQHKNSGRYHRRAEWVEELPDTLISRNRSHSERLHSSQNLEDKSSRRDRVWEEKHSYQEEHERGNSTRYCGGWNSSMCQQRQCPLQPQSRQAFSKHQAFLHRLVSPSLPSKIGRASCRERV